MKRKPSELITWDFTLAREGQVSRYGRVGEMYVKQFLPAGIEFPERHPPRAIDGRTYQLAKKIAEQQGG